MCAPRNVLRRVVVGGETNISPETVNAGMLETSVIGDLFYVKNLEAVRRSGAERCGAAHPPAVRSVHLSCSSEFGESDTKQQGLSKLRPLRSKKGRTHHIRV